MMSVSHEKRLLQLAICIACFVPLSAGGYGLLTGAAWLDGGGINLDSHFRYLSGLLFGIGLAFLQAVPRIEQHRQRMQLLTLIVFIGGLARLYGATTMGLPDQQMTLAIGMELIITPLLCIWQARVAYRYRLAAIAPP